MREVIGMLRIIPGGFVDFTLTEYGYEDPDGQVVILDEKLSSSRQGNDVE